MDFPGLQAVTFESRYRPSHCLLSLKLLFNDTQALTQILYEIGDEFQ